ncbi:TetR family transcriptional regulator [Flavobacterium sp. NRK F10]|uniref:TetR/AcrR family transcriptional regulator n=1 Tax=Flavobacterium sp. NRK F10 TaxID=2954931 RepID=UPI002090B0E4|nr:TetR family transcriptional regulator [Flavobacterium sp. NRK F10]MCO6176064.1 TetR family transcriptional regulator [Flavobacterium sp. NRK F10]
MELNAKQIEIITIAETLFAEKGFDGTSIRDIAKAADINIAMISYYFGSKEKLLEAIVLNRISAMRLMLANLFEENISPIEKMEKLVRFYVHRIYENRSIYQILHVEIISQKRDINYDVFIDIKKQNLDLIEDIIKEGQEQKVFRPNIKVLMIPPVIIGTLTQFYTNKAFYQKVLDLKTEEEFEQYIYSTFTDDLIRAIHAIILN